MDMEISITFNVADLHGSMKMFTFTEILARECALLKKVLVKCKVVKSKLIPTSPSNVGI